MICIIPSSVLPLSSVANESKETLASQPNLIDKLANAALISNAGAVESDISDESVEDNDEYSDESSEEYEIGRAPCRERV